MTAGARRRRLDQVLAAFFMAASLFGLARAGLETSPSPPLLAAGPAAYRPDGGQRLGPGGALPPNALTGLNLGRQVDLRAAPVRLSAALPGLGPATAAKVRQGDCLGRRPRLILAGLVREICGPNNP